MARNTVELEHVSTADSADRRSISAERFKDALERSGFWEKEEEFRKIVSPSTAVPSEFIDIALGYEAWNGKYPLLGEISSADARGFFDMFIGLVEKARGIADHEAEQWKEERKSARKQKESALLIMETADSHKKMERGRAMLSGLAKSLGAVRSSVLEQAFSLDAKERKALDQFAQRKESTPSESSPDISADQNGAVKETVAGTDAVEPEQVSSSDRPETRPVDDIDTSRVRSPFNAPGSHGPNMGKDTEDMQKEMARLSAGEEGLSEDQPGPDETRKELERVRAAIDAGHTEYWKKNGEIKEIKRSLDPTGRRGIEPEQASQELAMLRERLETLEARQGELLKSQAQGDPPVTMDRPAGSSIPSEWPKASKGTRRREIQDEWKRVEDEREHLEEMVKDKEAYIALLESQGSGKGTARLSEPHQAALDQLYELRAKLGDSNRRRRRLLDEWDSLGAPFSMRYSSGGAMPERDGNGRGVEDRGSAKDVSQTEETKQDTVSSQESPTPQSSEELRMALDQARADLKQFRKQLDEIPEVFRKPDMIDDYVGGTELVAGLKAAEARLAALREQEKEMTSPGPVKENPEEGKEGKEKETVPEEKEEKKGQEDKEREKLPPEERILADRFREEFGIEWKDLAVMEGFEELSIGRKHLLLENLRQITVGRIREEAADTAEEDRRKGAFYARIWKGITKRYQIAAQEKLGAEALKVGGLEKHGEILKQLILSAQAGPEAELVGGEIQLDFVGVKEGMTDAQREAVRDFNTAAAALAHIPYGWSFEAADKRDREKYRTFKEMYDSARDALIRTGLGVDENGSPTGISSVELNGSEHRVQMQRFFVQVPDAEDALMDIRSQAAWRKMLLDTVTERGLYLGYGYLGRSVLAGALGLAAAPVVAAGSGGMAAWFRAGKDLERQDALRRRKGMKGKKETEGTFVDSRQMTSRIEVLLDQLVAASTDPSPESDKRVQKVRTMLRSRIEYAKKKDALGKISYGDGSGDAAAPGVGIESLQVANRMRLAQTLIRAEAQVAGSHKNGKTMRRLEHLMEANTTAVEKRRMWYKIRAAGTGAAISSGFALAGVALREAAEATSSHKWTEQVKESLKGHTPAPGSRLPDVILPPPTETAASAIGKSAEAAREALTVKPGSGSSIERELIDRYMETGAAADKAEAGRMAHRAVLDWAREHAQAEGVTEKQLLQGLGRIRSAEITLDGQGRIADLEFDPLKPLRHAEHIHVPRAQVPEDLPKPEDVVVPDDAVSAVSVDKGSVVATPPPSGPEAVSGRVALEDAVISPSPQEVSPDFLVEIPNASHEFPAAHELFLSIQGAARESGSADIMKAAHRMLSGIYGGEGTTAGRRAFINLLFNNPAGIFNDKANGFEGVISDEQFNNLREFRGMAEAVFKGAGQPRINESMGDYVFRITQKLIGLDPNKPAF